METNAPQYCYSKIKSIVRRKLDFWDPVDFKIKKLIKRNIALHEKGRYAKDSIFAEKLINTKLTSRKWTKRVNLSFVELREKTTGLLRFLKRNRNLTHLNLTFQECFDSKNLVELAQTLNSSIHLISITIDLKYSTALQEKGAFFHRFAFLLRKLPQLKESIIQLGEHNQLAFSLDLIKYDFAEIPSLSVLKQQNFLTKNWIFRQAKLTTLMFDMQMQPGLYTEDFKKLASFISQNKKLETCQISLPKETVILSTKKIQPLLDSFLHLPNLKILKLSFLMSNHQPSLLSHQAFKLPSLQKIYLKIEFIQPTLKNLQKNLQALSEVDRIYSLELDLSKSSLLNDGTLQEIAQATHKLNILRKLSLKFQECKKVTENGIVSLLKTTSSRLTKISLDFTDCCSITQSISPRDQFHQNSDDENIISNLEKLSLSFANCQEITRVTFSQVQKLLLQAKNLQKLNLNFQGINKKLITPLPIFHQNHLKFLTDLGLIFKDCNKINSPDDTLSSRDISRLGDFISSRQTLRNVNLDVLKCKNIPPQFFTNFLNTLSHCPTLRNLTLSMNSILDRDFLSATEKFEMRPTGNYKIKILKNSNGYETTDHLHDTYL